MSALVRFGGIEGQLLITSAGIGQSVVSWVVRSFRHSLTLGGRARATRTAQAFPRTEATGARNE